jgi:hypothetical protein
MALNARNVLNHITTIVRRDAEVTEVAISSEGISCKVDTRAGLRESEIVTLIFDMYDGFLRCVARTDACPFVGEWFIQGTSHDHDAAWLAIMSNRTGYGAPWLETPEFFEEV